MVADKTMPGVSEEDFIAKFGFGVATLYTGSRRSSPRVTVRPRWVWGGRNIQIFKNLSPADQVAYNRALFGENKAPPSRSGSSRRTSR